MARHGEEERFNPSTADSSSGTAPEPPTSVVFSHMWVGVVYCRTGLQCVSWKLWFN